MRPNANASTLNYKSQANGGRRLTDRSDSSRASVKNSLQSSLKPNRPNARSSKASNSSERTQRSFVHLNAPDHSSIHYTSKPHYNQQQMGEQAKKPSKKQQKQHKQEEKPKEKQKEKPKEKPKEKESSQEDEADIDLNQLEGGMEQMEVSFLVGQIQEDYYHSLKTILLRYAHITKTTNAELADALVANRTIGNVVLADDDEEQDEDEEEEQEGEDDEDNVYSVLSILSGKSGVGKKIRSIVLKSIEKKDFPEEVSNILMDPSTSVLLNERLPNLPAFVATSSHQVFKKDLLELKHRSAADSSSLLGGYLLNVSEVQFEGEEELDKLIYSKFQDFEMCQRARVWWLGGNNPSHRRKADMRSLYYLITPQEYLLGVDRLKTYLAE